MSFRSSPRPDRLRVGQTPHRHRLRSRSRVDPRRPQRHRHRAVRTRRPRSRSRSRSPARDDDRQRRRSPLKGTRHLLEAFATVCETIDAELVVVGEFDEGGLLRAARLELGLADAIETHSEISYERMVELYGSADVAVVPSIYEGFGLPAGEALACGVPVVATTGGGFPKWSATPASRRTGRFGRAGRGRSRPARGRRAAPNARQTGTRANRRGVRLGASRPGDRTDVPQRYRDARTGD